MSGDYQDIGSRTQYVSDDGANGGPLLFQDNIDSTEWHVWIDEFTGGYKPFETHDITKYGYTLSKSTTFPKNLKQGSVTPLTQQEYNDLKNVKFSP